MIQLDRDRLSEAAHDLRFLLNRGYPKERSLDFVAKKYLLRKVERNALYRGVLSDEEASEIAKKKMKPKQLAGCIVGVDGFNVINTIESFYGERPLMLCDDEVVRDLVGVHGRFRFSDDSLSAIQEAVETLKQLKVVEARVYYDAQVSGSGEIAAATRRIMEEQGLGGLCQTDKSVDRRMLQDDVVAVTSDSAVLLRSKKFFDLAGYIVLKKGGKTKLLQLSELN